MSAWACIGLARQHDPGSRLPFELLTRSGWLRIGSVARQHLTAVDEACKYLGHADQLGLSDGNVRLQLTDAGQRSELLEGLNEALRARGFIPGWRHEQYRICTSLQSETLAVVERASARFWGLLTFGAHCNGYVADADGRPTHLWIARRSPLKATDPGMLDNLVGGGVPWDQTPAQTLEREAWEEAGLTQAHIAALRPAGTYTLLRDVPEGRQWEELHVFDLQLDTGFTPVNQDGEVEAFHRMPVSEALHRAASGDMTVDASLATLDFALRHQLLAQPELQQLAPRMASLRRPAND